MLVYAPMLHSAARWEPGIDALLEQRRHMHDDRHLLQSPRRQINKTHGLYPGLSSLLAVVLWPLMDGLL